jgi:hypothetical protein
MLQLLSKIVSPEKKVETVVGSPLTRWSAVAPPRRSCVLTFFFKIFIPVQPSLPPLLRSHHKFLKQVTNKPRSRLIDSRNFFFETKHGNELEEGEEDYLFRSTLACKGQKTSCCFRFLLFQLLSRNESARAWFTLERKRRSYVVVL